MVDSFYDALKDSVLILPFIFAVYLFLEILEHSRGKRKIEEALSGKFAPLVAAGAGVIPQCGFSVMCAKLFDGGLITAGTLVAAFISTSDEGIVVLIAGGANFAAVAALIVIKTFYAAIAGGLVNTFLPNLNNPLQTGGDGAAFETDENFFDRYIYHPIFHTLKIFLFIFAVNLGFNFLFYFIGEQTVYAFMAQNVAVQPLLSAIVGLVPNCAASVILAEAYSMNVLSFGALTAGLSANCGIGLAVLFKNRQNLKKNFILLFLLYIISVLLGCVLTISGIF